MSLDFVHKHTHESPETNFTQGLIKSVTECVQDEVPYRAAHAAEMIGLKNTFKRTNHIYSAAVPNNQLGMVPYNYLNGKDCLGNTIYLNGVPITDSHKAAYNSNFDLIEAEDHVCGVFDDADVNYNASVYMGDLYTHRVMPRGNTDPGPDSDISNYRVINLTLPSPPGHPSAIDLHCCGNFEDGHYLYCYYRFNHDNGFSTPDQTIIERIAFNGTTLVQEDRTILGTSDNIRFKMNGIDSTYLYTLDTITIDFRNPDPPYNVLDSITLSLANLQANGCYLNNFKRVYMREDLGNFWIEVIDYPVATKRFHAEIDRTTGLYVSDDRDVPFVWERGISSSGDFCGVFSYPD